MTIRESVDSYVSLHRAVCIYGITFVRVSSRQHVVPSMYRTRLSSSNAQVLLHYYPLHAFMAALPTSTPALRRFLEGGSSAVYHGLGLLALAPVPAYVCHPYTSCPPYSLSSPLTISERDAWLRRLLARRALLLAEILRQSSLMLSVGSVVVSAGVTATGLRCVTHVLSLLSPLLLLQFITTPSYHHTTLSYHHQFGSQPV